MKANLILKKGGKIFNYEELIYQLIFTFKIKSKNIDQNRNLN